MTKTLPIRALICLLATGALTLSACSKASQSTAQNNICAQPAAPAAIGGTFTLINQDGATVTREQYLGKPQLIYFGFGFCPDVCPTSLQRMGAATALLGARASDITPLFITIDPERDTPELLSLYLTANGFPENLVGLTGTQEQIDAATAAWRVYKKRVDDPQSAAGYTMDHSDIVYLMNNQGDLVDIFTHEDTPADMAGCISALLDAGT